MLKKRGLTLGKYAPFHRGHELIIQTALSEMDEVIVIIYDCPEITDIPLNVRSNWIKELYPEAIVIEASDGPTEVGITTDITKKHEDYIINQLGLHGITHFYSSEFYGEHMSLALGAINRIVDKERIKIPVSATQVRTDPYTHREYLHPRVYRDLITNVVFLGAPSTGKTTISSKLAQELNTVWMPEYGREYWESHQRNRRLSQDQLVEIAEEHLRREENLLYKANKYLFTDTNAITTYMFSLSYHGTAPPRLVKLANKAISRYDLCFVCDTDVPYHDTWDRSGNISRSVFQKEIISDLLIRKVPYFLLQGTLDERVLFVKRQLARYRKYENLLELF